MDFGAILLAFLIMAVFGLILGLLSALASKFLSVKKDERIDLIVDELPKANCGGCGYAGCESYAQAIVSDGAPVNKCPVGGDKVAAAVAKVMGVESKKTVRMRAQVL